jgi:subtilisin family serine protease
MSASAVSALRLTFAGPVMPWVPTELQIEAVDATGAVVPDTMGRVSLVVDTGVLLAEPVTLAQGRATSMLTFEAPVAPVTLTASLGDVTQTVVVDLAPIAPVPGGPGDPALAALPYLPYIGRDIDYAPGAPGFGAQRVSFNTFTLVLAEQTTLAELNALLAEHNAGVVGFGPGAAGVTGPIVAIRGPTAEHTAALSTLAALRGEARVVAAYRERADTSLEVVPEPGSLEKWRFERDDQAQPAEDGNWGLERVRVPQTWNLTAAAELASGTDGRDRRNVAVMEFGFVPHADLSFDGVTYRFLNSLSESAEERQKDHDHALHVLGTIAAIYGRGSNGMVNSDGVDGVNPLARAQAAVRSENASDSWAIQFILEAQELPRVVNISMGIPWALRGVVPNDDGEAQAELRAEAEAVIASLQAHEAGGRRVPFLVVSAGNDSESASLGNEDVEARWNSGYATAALVLGREDVLVVEAVGRAPGDALERAAFSNVGGHVSAPGVDIFSTVADDGATSAVVSTSYMLKSGTSMAAPHVAGIASFLVSLEPRLTNSELKRIILDTAVPGPAGAAPVVDAFAAALQIDVVTGNDKVLRALLDIDDGTPDGNTRVDPLTGAAVTTDSGGRYGPRGDGVIDMRDFRRFRDALLAIEGSFGTDLDGDATNPKRDLNKDGVLDTPAGENVFPRADFNGSGRISRTETVHVGGTLDAEATDLQVLMQLFDDADVAAEELPALLASGDVFVDAGTPFQDPSVDALTLEFAGTDLRTVRVDRDGPPVVVTLPVGGWSVTIDHLDASEVVLGSSTHFVSTTLGGDVTLVLGPMDPPSPLYYLSVYGNEDTVAACEGEPRQFYLLGRIEDYDTEDPVQGETLELLLGGVSRGSGLSNAQGEVRVGPFTVQQPGAFDAEVRHASGSKTYPYWVTSVQSCRWCFDEACQRTSVETTGQCLHGENSFEYELCQREATCQCERENCRVSSSVVGGTPEGTRVFEYTCGPGF